MDDFVGISQTHDWTETSTDDMPFFSSLARATEGRVLEIGAGTGRVTIPLAVSGKDVTALDISESMLAKAPHKWAAKGNGPNLRFVIGDFRDFRLDLAFGPIAAPGRVLEHALSDCDRHASFQSCARHLSPGGIIALHVWGPSLDGDLATLKKSRTINPTEEHGVLRFYWREERDFASETRRHFFRIEELDARKRKWEHTPIALS